MTIFSFARSFSSLCLDSLSSANFFSCNLSDSNSYALGTCNSLETFLISYFSVPKTKSIPFKVRIVGSAMHKQDRQDTSGLRQVTDFIKVFLFIAILSLTLFYWWCDFKQFYGKQPIFSKQNIFRVSAVGKYCAQTFF